ncbi:MAG: branched-chain amino acid ABC transporter substrate-binding protein [Gammaproteobacteria bacterium]|nr:MAG: branched-chain amino acid ABC transporter substrate-binding protein [Gammaproteobacteria bacterium]RLA20832.1 MAG: branched-chain amino acid ABC transporter substrate-binding protein [Gammaproteobacteria bacterium]
MVRKVLQVITLLGWSVSVFAVDSEALEIVWLTQQKVAAAALSNLDSVPLDEGLQGAQLAIKDNNTTGRFTKQKFRLKAVRVPQSGNVENQFNELVQQGYQHIIVDLTADQLAVISAAAEGKSVHIYNSSVSDDRFRGSECRDNLLHMVPSRAMRTDALGQYLLKKRWKKLFVVVGPTKEDRDYAVALRRAAKKFGLKIVEEKNWTHTYDARRTAQSDVPLFTRGTEYDVLVVADEQGLFGEYLEYRTWFPRPVVGTQGLVSTAWHRTHEQWGAVQLQNRFKKQTGRWMSEMDYAVWLAVRAIGEAATRSGSLEFDKIRGFMTSEQFALAGFKGKKLSFRSWNNQLRQPVLLAAARSMVAVAPLPGFLHPKTMMDTLGFDRPESSCKLGN